jgi:hypothetical protein
MSFLRVLCVSVVKCIFFRLYLETFSDIIRQYRQRFEGKFVAETTQMAVSPSPPTGLNSGKYVSFQENILAIRFSGLFTGKTDAVKQIHDHRMVFPSAFSAAMANWAAGVQKPSLICCNTSHFQQICAETFPCILHRISAASAEKSLVSPSTPKSFCANSEFSILVTGNE